MKVASFCFPSFFNACHLKVKGMLYFFKNFAAKHSHFFLLETRYSRIFVLYHLSTTSLLIALCYVIIDSTSEDSYLFTSMFALVYMDGRH